MSFLVDTDTCSAHLKNPAIVTNRFLQYSGRLHIAVLTVQAGLLDAGRPTPVMDLLIAATALVHGLTLVTHNTQDFGHIPGLPLVDWLTP